MNINQDEIPKSIIKGSGVILGKPLHPTKGLLDVIYLGSEIGIFGLQKCPYFMFATHHFNENSLSSNVLLDLYKLKELYLRPNFSKSNIETTQYVTIPNWITNFKELEMLKLDHVNLDNLFVINVLNIKHLMLSDVKYTNKEKLKRTIGELKGLEEISYDKSLQSFVDEIMQKTTVKFTYNT